MSSLDPLEQRHLKAEIFSSYFGVGTALLIPAAIALATYWFNESQAYIAERQNCIKQHLEITDKLYSDKGVPDDERENRRAAILADTQLLLADCQAVHVVLTQLDQIKISDYAQNTTSKDVANAAINVLQNNAAITGITSPALKAALSPPPRIYIQVSSRDQLGPATSLQTNLQHAQFDGGPILVPPIQTRNSGQRKSVLRCFTQPDCEKAQSIVGLVNGMLETPMIEKEDLSSHPGLSAGNRPLHYELWFAPGPIQLRS